MAADDTITAMPGGVLARDSAYGTEVAAEQFGAVLAKAWQAPSEYC